MSHVTCGWVWTEWCELWQSHGRHILWLTAESCETHTTLSHVRHVPTTSTRLKCNTRMQWVAWLSLRHIPSDSLQSHVRRIPLSHVRHVPVPSAGLKYNTRMRGVTSLVNESWLLWIGHDSCEWVMTHVNECRCSTSHTTVTGSRHMYKDVHVYL